MVNIPQTGYKSQHWQFNQAVLELWRHLEANPGILKRYPDLPQSLEQAEDFVDRTNAARMLSIKGAESFVISDQAVMPPKSTPPQPPKGLAAAVGGVRRIAAGVGTLLAWLGRGATPVAAELAEARARVCAVRPGGKRCPQNVDQELTRLYTVKLANVLRQQLELRKDMKLATSHDAALGICQACACPLRLKVHVKLEDIVAHMPDFVKRDLDPECWILKETKP